MSNSLDNYRNLSEYLGPKSERPAPSCGQTTRIVRRSATSIAVKYHATDIVTHHKSGRVVYNSGGWRTATTKLKMDEYGPVGISQRDGVWYLSLRNPAYDRDAPYAPGTVVDGRYVSAPSVNDGVPYWLADCGAFADGMSYYRGKVTGQITPEEIADHLAVARKSKREIRKFVKGITEESIPKMIAANAGDCFVCRFGAGNGTSCAASHLEEDYLHWNLVNVHGDRYFVSMAQHAVEADRAVSSHVVDALRKSVAKSLRAILLPDLAQR